MSEKKFKHRAEELATVFILRLIPWLPTSFWRLAGIALGTFCYYLVPIRKKVALHNLSIIDPALNWYQKEKITRRCYQNMAVNFFEFLSFTCPNRLQGFCSRVVNSHLADELQQSDQGVLLVSAHFGNWECLGLDVSNQRKARLNYVVRVQNNESTGVIFDNLRRRVGIGIIKRNSALRSVFRKLKKGEWVGFLCDQHARESGVEVKFFGQKVSWQKGAAHFSLKTGSPILPAFVGRGSDFHPHIRYCAPIFSEGFGSTPENIQVLSQKLATLFEREIRRDPGLWNLFHKRFER